MFDDVIARVILLSKTIFTNTWENIDGSSETFSCQGKKIKSYETNSDLLKSLLGSDA